MPWFIFSMSRIERPKSSGLVLSQSSISQCNGAPVMADNLRNRVRVGSFLTFGSVDSHSETAGLDTPNWSASCCWVKLE